MDNPTNTESSSEVIKENVAELVKENRALLQRALDAEKALKEVKDELQSIQDSIKEAQ
jgi:predicted nuclease with TOPRIM domain